jgi:methylated-DNA-protein-cysteine methyltransferase-like protein
MSSNDFFLRVYKVVKQIPFGRVTSYGGIAKVLGTPGSSRTVGYAMNASHNDPEIPAHRVVNRNGLLTGKHHFPGTNLMQQLLENEGLIIEEDQIKNFKETYWDPLEEIGLQD